MTDDERFDAFGMTVYHGGTSPTTTPYGFVGKKGYQTDTSGLMLLGHRYYDAGIGRFLSRDPIHDGNNWYAYCGNNPLDKTDPSGEQASVKQADNEPDYSTNIVSDSLDNWLFGGAAKNAGNMQGRADSGAVPQSAATKAELNVAGQIAMMALPETKALKVAGEAVKGVELAEKGITSSKNTVKNIIERAAPGRDGGKSRHIIEKLAGKTISVTHQVEKDGAIIHQHQIHIGTYGTQRRFPDAWIEHRTIGE